MTISVGVCVVSVFFCGFLFAQAQQPPQGRGGMPQDRDPRMEQMIDMMFRDMDTNHDGKISKSEWMAFQEKQFRLLDRDGKGFITKDDVRADMMQKMRPPQPPQERPMPPQ
jgi:hypothetical protein